MERAGRVLRRAPGKYVPLETPDSIEEFEPASAAPVRRLRTPPRGLFEGRVCTAIAEARERRLGKLVKDLQGEGYIDFRTHRCALDYGSYALIVVGDCMWSGRSGRPVATLPEEPATSIEPMWLLDLVRGVTDVEAQGEELASGRRRRHLRTHADMSRAAAVAPAGLPVPIGAARYSDLLHLPLEPMGARLESAFELSRFASQLAGAARR